jgi:hypothetical protein
MILGASEVTTKMERYYADGMSTPKTGGTAFAEGKVERLIDQRSGRE